MLIDTILKNFLKVILCGSLLTINSCINLTVSQRKEYDTMMTKATSSINMFSGNYANIITKTIGETGLLNTAKNEASRESFNIFRNYRFEINPHGSSYNFRIIDTREWNIFDYTCTLELGSTVFMTPGSFNLNDIGIYDKCVRH